MLQLYSFEELEQEVQNTLKMATVFSEPKVYDLGEKTYETP